jgi:hypothetical protein
MSTTTITHRPVPLIAAGAAVLAVVAGSLVLSVEHESGTPAAPPDSAQITVPKGQPQAHHFHPTTSGGRVAVGQ